MNPPAFSIFKTFRESCQLWWRHWKILVLLSLLVVMPVLSLNLIQNYLSPDYTEEYVRLHSAEVARQSFIMAAVTIPLSLLIFVIGVIKAAAILGVLKEPRAEIWPVIITHIRKYTWTLIRVQILLAIVPFVFGLVISIVVAASGPKLISSASGVMQFVLVFFAILYLVFIKFALANPLVVVEGMRARQSLRESWQMTRGRFGYVFGCYVILGTVDYFLNMLFDYFDQFSPGHGIATAGHVMTELFGCLWIVLGWTMYQQIKSVDAGEKVALGAPINLSPPESPSAL